MPTTEQFETNALNLVPVVGVLAALTVMVRQVGLNVSLPVISAPERPWDPYAGINLGEAQRVRTFSFIDDVIAHTGNVSPRTRGYR